MVLEVGLVPVGINRWLSLRIAYRIGREPWF